MTDNNEFDQVLDDALAEYRVAEPLAGMEERVLQRLSLQAAHRRTLWGSWSAVATAAVVLAVAAWIGLARRPQQEVTAPSTVRKQAIAPGRPAPASDTDTASQQLTTKQPSGARTVLHSTRVSAKVQLTGNEPVPMRERFPSPAPLQPEERMLLALATTHPEALLKEPESDKEIAFAPINITPLVKEAGGYEGEN